MEEVEHDGCFDGSRAKREDPIDGEEQSAAGSPPCVRLDGQGPQNGVVNHCKRTEGERSKKTGECEQEWGKEG